MSEFKKTATIPEIAFEKAQKPSVVDAFLKGCARGFKVGIENITPAMILGYTLVYILNETGLMNILGVIFSPVMALFGLPGEAFAVLISAFFAKASGAATAATMYTNGALTLGQATMLLPACILMGTLIGHYARIVLVANTNKKWHLLLIFIPILDAAISLVIMRFILSVMGIA
jgi:spore maturation protein SpmB